MNNIYIMSAVRSPIGTFGGTLKNFHPVDEQNGCVQSCSVHFPSSIYIGHHAWALPIRVTPMNL